MSLSYRNQSTELLNDQFPSNIKTSQLIWVANQLIGYYMRGTLVVKELIHLTKMLHSYRNKSLDLQWSSIDLLEFDWNVNLNGLKFALTP